MSLGLIASKHKVIAPVVFGFLFSGCAADLPRGISLDSATWSATPNPIACGSSGIVTLTADFSLNGGIMQEANTGIRAALIDDDVFLWNVHISDSNELHSLIRPPAGQTQSVRKVFTMPVRCSDDCELIGNVNDSDESDPELWVELVDENVEEDWYTSESAEVSCVNAG